MHLAAQEDEEAEEEEKDGLWNTQRSVVFLLRVGSYFLPKEQFIVRGSGTLNPPKRMLGCENFLFWQRLLLTPKLKPWTPKS